jgi:hypothetical protein
VVVVEGAAAVAGPLDFDLAGKFVTVVVSGEVQVPYHVAP